MEQLAMLISRPSMPGMCTIVNHQGEQDFFAARASFPSRAEYIALLIRLTAQRCARHYRHRYRLSPRALTHV